MRKKWSNTYYENNKNSNIKDYLENTKEKRLAYGRDYYQKNKEARLEYYQKNREKRIAYQREYRKRKDKPREYFKDKLLELLGDK